MEAGGEAQNKLSRRRDVWHAMLFYYTTGEIVQMKGYVPYATRQPLRARLATSGL